LSAPSSAPGADGVPPTDFNTFIGGLQRSDFLLGDLFGVRTVLSRFGASLAVQETSEGLGNATGGARRAAEYDGLTQIIGQVDTQRAFGWYGGLFNVSALQTHGRNLSAESLLTLQTSSGIEADRSTRLWELWYDQKLLPEDRLDVRIGQQSADQEFLVTPNGAYFLNTMFGWPLVPSADLPGGGPAYPLSALGVRLRYRPINPVTVLIGVFNGSPAPRPGGDAQKTNPSGVSFPTNGGTLAFIEAQYSAPAIGAMVYPGTGAPLGRTYKVGAYLDTEAVGDLRIDTAGGLLASPSSTGIPLKRRGDYALYAVADQMIWRQADYPNRSVSVFARVVDAPLADRNLVDFSLNAGVVYHDPMANRPDDTLGLAIGYGHVSRQEALYDRDVALLAPPGSALALTPMQTSETFVEATYQYQARPWWQVQPDLQVIINPSGGILNPDAPTQKVGTEVVLGVRTNILF